MCMRDMIVWKMALAKFITNYGRWLYFPKSDFLSPEAVIRKCFVKKVFLKISQI